MTIKLLTPRDLTIGGRTVTYPAGALVTLDAATETGLINSKEATATLTGGITYTPPVPSGQPVPLTVIPSDQGVEKLLVGNQAYRPGVSLRAYTNRVNLRYIGDPVYKTFDTSNIRQIFQSPVTGLVAVRARHESDSPTPPEISYTAFAGGRNISETNPTGRNGAAATWRTANSTLLSAASAGFATNGLAGYGYTPWVYIDVPEAVDGGVGGYIYVGTKLASGTARCLDGSSQTYSAYANSRLLNCRYRAFLGGSDHTSVNQNAMPDPASDQSFNPVAELQIIPVRRCIAIDNWGDSTTEAIGNSGLGHPYSYSWGTIAANLALADGVALHVANRGYSGKESAPYYLNILEDRLANEADYAPDAVVIQPFSVNDGTFDQTKIDAGILKSMMIASELRRRGSTVIFRTVLPSGAASLTADNRRKAANQMFKSAGDLVFDFEALFSDGASPARMSTDYSWDGTHLLPKANEIAGAAFYNLLKRILVF